MDSPAARELQAVLTHYDLGELVDFQKNERGFVNTAYAICTLVEGQRQRYFLRKYKPGIRHAEVLFEHSLIEHLLESGAPVARIHHTRTGQTFLHLNGAYYTIFDYLPGDDTFTWIDPLLSPPQLASSASTLAHLHSHASGFTPLGNRTEPRIRELLPIIRETWAGCPARSKHTVFDDRIASQLDLIRDDIDLTLAALHEPAALALPETIIHSDYHPGNLKFTGDTVTGVFDFDWSKRDLRLFDLGLALWYFCTSWQAAQDGALRLDWAETFLRTYQDTLLARATGAASSPSLALTPDEARYLPVMVRAGNLYVLHWTVLDYFAKDVDPVAYLVFLDHSLNFARWYAAPGNQQALRSMIAGILLPEPRPADPSSPQALR